MKSIDEQRTCIKHLESRKTVGFSVEALTRRRIASSRFEPELCLTRLGSRLLAREIEVPTRVELVVKVYFYRRECELRRVLHLLVHLSLYI